MTNYGHPLRFGVTIGGEAQSRSGQTSDGPHPAAVVELALEAERLGYDHVVLAGDDLDGVSLAGWIAARSSRIQVGVSHDDPTQRPASTVARSASSLQLLSGHRAMLVLGAGATPGESDNLAEVVAVIRSLGDTTHPRVSQSGTHHRLVETEPGPVLERAVPLWLSGASPAVVELAGRVADGWTVECNRLTPLAEFTEVMGLLDRAAIGAGRDVREIRRGVTLTDSEPIDVETLVALVVDHGVSDFRLRLTAAREGEVAMRTFIDDVAAGVRVAAEAALPPGSLSTRPLRRADVRDRRRPDIAYDELPEDLAEAAVEPGDPAFATVRSTYLRGGNPGLVLRPRTISEVASAVAFARTHRHLPLGLRSGGHGISGRSTNDGGLVIDVGALNEITVLDEATRLVRIGPGARWRDVASVLQPHGWALSSGDYGGVGVGGLATAGGIGFLNRKHGLTIDHLTAVEMVLADGSFVRATESENPDLFWAARGAGANFGVAVGFEFVVDEVGDVGWAQLAFEAPDPAAYLEAFGRVVAELPRETTPFLILGRGMAQLMAMVDSDDPEVIVGQLQPFAEIAPLVQQQVVVAPYAAVMNMFPQAPHDGRGEPVSRSALVHEITPEFAAASAELINSGASHWYQIRAVGGAVSDVAPDATAYAHRDAQFSLTVMGANAQRLDRWFEPVRRHSDGLYLSFESDRAPDRIHDAFPPATLTRLRDLKSRLDPENLFQDNFNIEPAQPAHDRSAS